MTSTFLNKGHLLRELTDPHMEGLMVCDRCGGGESELETPCAERLAERLSQNSWKLEAYANIQNWVEGMGFSAFVEFPDAFADLMKQRDELKRRLGEGPARVQELERKLDDALAANKEMGDAIEKLAKVFEVEGDAGWVVDTAIRFRNKAFDLCDSISNCQDWRGTDVGDQLEIIGYYDKP